MEDGNEEQVTVDVDTSTTSDDSSNEFEELPSFRVNNS